jgi:putative transposase
MHYWRNLSLVRWECKYHAIIVPEYRKERPYGKQRVRESTILNELCLQKGVELPEGQLMADTSTCV